MPSPENARLKTMWMRHIILLAWVGLTLISLIKFWNMKDPITTLLNAVVILISWGIAIRIIYKPISGGSV